MSKLLAAVVATGFAIIFASMAGAAHAEVSAKSTRSSNGLVRMTRSSSSAYDDPKVHGVTCYLSRAKTGGMKGAVGVAEDLAEASIACRQVGAISFEKPLPAQEEMFSERISLVFKKLRVVRMVDAKHNTLVYLTYSDRVIEGSPQNSVTAVAVDHATPIPLKK